jgi:ABC-type dipeptide/oligopeptide/nickel transport system ATPase component
VKELCIRDSSNRTLVGGSSFKLRAGETLCLIGESGSGKTLTGKALLGMLPFPLKWTGDIFFRDEPIRRFRRRDWQRVRGKRIGTIFQQPEQALHPAIPIGRQLGDLLRSHLPITRLAAERKAKAMLGKVSLRDVDRVMKSYPYELSGGMNQRVMIAMALLLEPELLIADEPTSALDVTTQAEILTLLKGLSSENQMSMLFVTHDLLIANYLADTIAVMYRGEIVEQGRAADVLKHPQHGYTRELWQYRSAFMLP